MSVTMCLYKVIDVKYVGNRLNHIYEEEISDLSDEEYEKIDSIPEWEDGIKHDMIDLTWLKLLCKLNNGKLCTLKHLNKFNQYIFKDNYCTYKYIPVDEICYWQGWNLKKRFFNKKITTVFCVTRKQMVLFMRRYLKPSEWNMFKEKFINNMVEGEMIFECSW